MAKVSFNNKQSPFFPTLKEKVNHYFSNNNIHTSGNKKLYFKSLIQLCSATCLYFTLVFFTPGTFVSIILCCILGVNMGVIGFNIMHEGGHMSFSKHKWVNEISGHFLNILGGSIHFWKIKHNVNHHTYTNIAGMDSDIDIEPFMRLHKDQKRHWYHRFQHIYWVFLYGMSYVTWIFYDDFVKYFAANSDKAPASQKLAFKEKLIFWLTKVFYISMYIVVPIIFAGLINTIIGFSIIVFICGLSISIVFQMAHVVEETQFPLPNPQSNTMEQEWAIHQITTTANFSTKNKIVSWLVGGLNFQVEHHLFPKISHVHYPIINLLVKETCEEFNIKYIEYSSFFKAFRSHMTLVRRLGSAA
jgi:linoleoyl-CoA desaturase